MRIPNTAATAAPIKKRQNEAYLVACDRILHGMIGEKCTGKRAHTHESGMTQA